MEEQMLSSEEAQQYLGVGQAAFWNLVRRYNIPKYKIPLKPRRVFFKKEDLDELKRPRPAEGEEGKAAA